MAENSWIFSLICFMFCAAIISIEAGKWTDWRDITLCDAMPCGCPGKIERRGCKRGIKYQLRMCIFGSDGTQCKFDHEGGPIRRMTCINRGVCPGWSEYIPTSECEPLEWPRGTRGIRVETRYCNNPLPIHPEIKCADSAGMEALEEERFPECVYVATTTTSTTAAPTTSTTKLPCCTPGTTPESWHSTTPGPELSTDSYFDYASLLCDPSCGDYDYFDDDDDDFYR